MPGIHINLLFCEYLNSINLRILHKYLMIYLLCRCGKHEKQDKDIESEENTSKKHRLNAKHFPDLKKICILLNFIY